MHQRRGRSKGEECACPSRANVESKRREVGHTNTTPTQETTPTKLKTIFKPRIQTRNSNNQFKFKQHQQQQVTILDEQLRALSPDLESIAAWRARDADLKARQDELAEATAARDAARAAYDGLRKQRLDGFMAGARVCGELLAGVCCLCGGVWCVASFSKESCALQTAAKDGLKTTAFKATINTPPNNTPTPCRQPPYNNINVINDTKLII